MDKDKLSIAITGPLLCAMLYANVSSTRADMRLPKTATLTPAYVNAAPGTLVAPAKVHRHRNRHTQMGAAAEQKAAVSGEQRFRRMPEAPSDPR